MILISDFKQIDKNKWQKLLFVSPYQSPFQTPDFFEFYNSVSGIGAEVFAVEENDEYTSLVVITIQKEKGLTSFFSKRGIVFGGPLILGTNEKSLQFLLTEIQKYYKSKVIYLEIRNFFDYSFYGKVFESLKWKFIPYLNITLNVGGKNMEELMLAMSYNRRRQIKLSFENEACFKECETDAELEALYKILTDLYNSRVKKPFPEIDYFKKMATSKIGKILVVIHNNKVIAGAFCIYLKDHSVYTLYYCGLREYDKKIYPTHLAVMASIDYALKNNCKIVDFMGAGLKGENYGVRKYKQEFGGILNEYGRYRKILNPFLFNIGLLGLEIRKKILK